MSVRTRTAQALCRLCGEWCGASVVIMTTVLSENPNPETLRVVNAEARAAAPLRVGSIEAVARSRLLTVSLHCSLLDVASMLSSAQISVVVVCDSAGKPLGIITETTLIRRLAKGQADFFSTCAGDVMTPGFVMCAPEDLLSEVLTMMHERGVIHVLLGEANGPLLGIVNARDGLRALLAAGNYEEALLRNYIMGIGYQ